MGGEVYAGEEFMTERIFNLYLFIQSGLTASGIIQELGARVHERSGTDSDKIAFLQKQAAADLAQVQRFPVPAQYVLVAVNSAATQAGLDYRGYEKLVQGGRHLEVFEEVFQALGAPADPLICITPVVDGKIQIEALQEM